MIETFFDVGKEREHRHHQGGETHHPESGDVGVVDVMKNLGDDLLGPRREIVEDERFEGVLHAEPLEHREHQG